MKPILKLSVVLMTLRTVTSLPSDRRNPLDASDEVLSKPDQRAGRRLDEWAELDDKSGNPEEQGGYFEGDIVIKFQGRSGAVSEKLKWEDGTVPYIIKGNFSKFK